MSEVSPHPFVPSHGGECKESEGSFAPPLWSPPTEGNVRNRIYGNRRFYHTFLELSKFLKNGVKEIIKSLFKIFYREMREMRNKK
ncbi:MAG: hypothetical protein LBP62_04740 [Clostridiales bacterium]|nr:hypothetical protein [Clostridiales bacterium]